MTGGGPCSQNIPPNWYICEALPTDVKLPIGQPISWSSVGSLANTVPNPPVGGIGQLVGTGCPGTMPAAVGMIAGWIRFCGKMVACAANSISDNSASLSGGGGVVTVAVGVNVGVGEGVSVIVALAVTISVAEGIAVAVSLAVAVGVALRIIVAVAVGIIVAVSVGSSANVGKLPTGGGVAFPPHAVNNRTHASMNGRIFIIVLLYTLRIRYQFDLRTIERPIP